MYSDAVAPKQRVALALGDDTGYPHATSNTYELDYVNAYYPIGHANLKDVMKAGVGICHRVPGLGTSVQQHWHTT